MGTETKVLRAGEAGWYRCPVTGAKLLRLTPESHVEDTPVYCRRCKREHLPLIREGRVLRTGE